MWTVRLSLKTSCYTVNFQTLWVYKYVKIKKVNASHRTGLRCHMSNGRQVSPYASDSYYIFLGGGVFWHIHSLFMETQWSPFYLPESTEHVQTWNEHPSIKVYAFVRNLCGSSPALHQSVEAIKYGQLLAVKRLNLFCLVYRSTNIHQFFRRCAFVLAGLCSLF